LSYAPENIRQSIKPAPTGPGASASWVTSRNIFYFGIDDSLSSRQPRNSTDHPFQRITNPSQNLKVAPRGKAGPAA